MPSSILFSLKSIKEKINRNKRILLTGLIAVSVSCGTWFILAEASIDNGANAIDGYGQYDDSSVNPQPVYTKAGVNNTLNSIGFNFATQSGGDIDTVNHRFFVADATNNRVLVFNLNNDNTFPDRIPDYVLGQPNFYSNTAANTQAGLNIPRDVAYDSVGNRIFVVETTGNRVKVFNVASITNGEDAVNILGQSGFTTATAATTQAGLSSPRSVEFDSSTNYLYVGDALNHRVMIFDVTAISDGENAVDVIGKSDDSITDPQPAYTKGVINDGPNRLGFSIVNANSTSFFDTTDHRFFVSDTTNNRVLIYNLNNDNTFPDRIPDYVLGQANFYTSTAANTQSGLNAPAGLAYDPVGDRLFVSEQTGNRIKVFNLASITNGEDAVNILGQSSYTTATAANSQTGLNVPLGLEYDAAGGRLFVSETTGNRVKIYNISDGITDNEPAANILGQALYTTATAANSQTGLNGPTHTAYDAVNQRLFVVEFSGHRVKVYNLADGITDNEPAANVLGQALYTTATAANSQTGLNNPYGAVYVASSTRLFVSEASGHRVKVYNFSDGITDNEPAENVLGQTTFLTATAANTQEGMSGARGISYDSTNQKLFVTQLTNNRITAYNIADGITDGETAVDGLGQYGDDNLADPQPLYTKTLANNGPNRIGLNLTGTADVAIDTTNHRLFVLDSTNNRVLVYNLDTDNTILDRIADNVIGQDNFYTNTAATTDDGLSAPVAIDYDSTGNRLFVAQANRVTVYDVSSITDGEPATFVLGQTDFTSTAAATTRSGFSSPARVLTDSASDRLFVFETGNNRVSVFNIASISNGEDAMDVLGQTNGDLIDPQPVYTTSTANNATTANKLGFNLSTVLSDVVIDSANHRMFAVDGGNNRVLVYQLDSNNDPLDHIPDYVLGQANFSSSTAAVTQAGLSQPSGLAYDSVENRLFVSQTNANRISVFSVATSTITNGMSAANVLGQSTFTDSAASNANTGLNSPYGIEYDATNGRLFVAQTANNRVAVFNISDGITDGEAAVNILGQTDFSGTGAANSDVGMNVPLDVAYESDRSYLYVAEFSGNRVKVYNLANGLTDGEAAIHVLGQSLHTTATAANSQTGMNQPYGVAHDDAGDRLFVAQAGNSRVTVFDTAVIVDGENATHVLGQSTFSATAAANTQAGLNAPRGIYYDALSGNVFVPQSGNHRISVFDAGDIAESSVSGTVYDTDGVTPLTGKTIALSIGGGTALATTTSHASTGEFTFSNVSVNAGNVLTLYIDGATEKAVTVTKGSGSNLTNINLVRNRLTTRCDNSSCGLTVSDLNTADNNADADITAIYTVSTQLYVTGGYDLHVPSGNTFAPGAMAIIGSDATSSDMIVAGTFTGASEKIILKGDLRLLSGSTFTAPTGTFSVQGDVVDSGTTFDGNDGKFVFDSANARTLDLDISFDNLYINNGLVAYWNFDERSGSTLTDGSGFGNTGALISSPTSSNDVPTLSYPNDRSWAFNGSSQYVLVTDSPELRGGQDLTVSTWFKMDTAHQGYIIAKSQSGSAKDWHLLANVTKVRFAYEAGGNNWDNVGLDTVSTLTPGVWYQTAFTYKHDTKVVNLYLNGVFEASTTLPTQSPVTAQDVSIGRRIDGSFPLFFDGNIDETRIYNRVLSPGEIALLASPGEITGLATTTLASNLDVNGSLTFQGIGLDTSSSNYSITVAGNFINRGALNARASTVTLDGTTQAVYGDSTFYGLSKTAVASSTLYFQATSTQTVTGPFTMNGGGSNYLSLHSTVGGSQWNINPQGTRNVTGVKVMDSENIDSVDIEATGVDLGNNLNWNFAGGTVDASPSVTLTAPTNGATVSGSAVTISATASDDVTLEGVTFLLDGVALAAEDTTSTYGITWDSTGVTDGAHTLAAVARDNASQYATSTISITVSNAVQNNNNNTTPATTNTNSAPLSGGGSSDGSAYYESVQNLPAPTTTTSTPSTTTTTTTTTVTYTRPSDGSDITILELQKFLNANGFLISVTGAGSPGKETNTLGAKTIAALARFQAASGVKPAVGTFGPITRRLVASMLKIKGNTVSVNTVIPVSPGTVCATIAPSEKGAEGTHVLNAQKILKSLTFLTATPNGYFGLQTEAAVRKFQIANNLSAVGVIGPQTSALLTKLSCK